MTPYDPVLSGEKVISVEINTNLEYSLETLIARRSVQELSNGCIVYLGFGISAAFPRALA